MFTSSNLEKERNWYPNESLFILKVVVVLRLTSDVVYDVI